MNPVALRVINQSGNPLPSYATAGAAGMDICAHLRAPITLQPLHRALVPTGLYLEIPEGYEVQVRPRSGLALKHGISLPNSPATIDSDYRGQLQVILINLGTENFVVENGMRIAQLVLAPVSRIQWVVAEELSSTTRGQGGFGHTGH